MNQNNSLPEGVPSDNASLSADVPRGAGRSDFDTATPRFPEAPRVENAARPEPKSRSDMMSKERQNLVLIIAVVTLALALTAVLRLYNPVDPMPLCSDQPEWNQYNCRAY